MAQNQANPNLQPLTLTYFELLLKVPKLCLQLSAAFYQNAAAPCAALVRKRQLRRYGWTGLALLGLGLGLGGRPCFLVLRFCHPQLPRVLPFAALTAWLLPPPRTVAVSWLASWRGRLSERKHLQKGQE